MTRHGRNATNSAVYSYHERRKDASTSGYGTEKCRLNKDSINGFDCCSLSLQPCRNPMVTQDGWLFDKESILKYIIQKKQEYARKMKEFERERTKEQRQMQELAEAERSEAVQKFERHEKHITQSGATAKSSSSTALPSFWVPSMTPQAEKTKLKKPDKTIYCPMSGKPLKMKDLMEVKFKEAPSDDAGTSLISRKERYVCAVTNDLLSNATPVVVLRPTGDVVTVECVEKVIRKDMIHPLTGQSLEPSDLIYLQRGGTGYSLVNQDTLKAQKHRPQLAIS